MYCLTINFLSQWPTYKNFCLTNFPTVNLSQIFEILNASVLLKQQVSEILKLILIVLAIPVGSASAERGFSVQNRVKSKIRNSLSITYLDYLMNIFLNGPDISEYCFDPAVEMWLNCKERRKL